MANKSITTLNRESIIRIEGDIKLLRQEMKNIKNNHISHLESRMNRIEKVCWTVCLIAISHLILQFLN